MPIFRARCLCEILGEFTPLYAGFFTIAVSQLEVFCDLSVLI